MEIVFMRYEQKYVIDTHQMDRLVDGLLKNGFEHDFYCPNGKYYTVYTVYYDTKDIHATRMSLNKDLYREKIRLRFYEYPIKDDTVLWLEIKKKLKGKGNKRRLPLNLEDSLNLMNNNINPCDENIVYPQIFSEIKYCLDSHKLKPLLFIKYNRLALFHAKEDIRLTFDINVEYSNIASFSGNLDLDLLPQTKDVIILEIKSLTNYPLWLANLLNELNIYSGSFSKHTNTYEVLQEGGISYVPD